MTANDDAPAISLRSSSGSMSSTSPTVAAPSALSSTVRSVGSSSAESPATSAASSGIISGLATHWSLSRPVSAPNTVTAVAARYPARNGRIPSEARLGRLGRQRDDLAGVAEPGAEAEQQRQLTALGLAGDQHFLHGQRNRGGRGVAGVLDVVGHRDVLGQAEVLLHQLVDAGVGLMR